MQPYNNNILFRPFEGDAVTVGGIIIPDSCKKLSNKGEIVAVGEKVKELKRGMIGYRVKDWGTEIINEGITYFLMEDTAIIALEE